MRRCFSLFILLTAPFALLGVGEIAPSPAAKTYRAFAGTYTTKTNSKGIAPPLRYASVGVTVLRKHLLIAES